MVGTTAGMTCGTCPLEHGPCWKLVTRSSQLATGNRQLATARLHTDPRRDMAPLRHDDDAVADVVAVAVGFPDSLLVDQPHAVSDARVLVDDDAIEHDVAADAERDGVCRGLFFVEVGAEQHRPRDLRTGMRMRPDADH